ncbi:glycoside hydrolase family 18 protein [Microbacterium deminutum]|uniref:chitinase n=1 Tax=Microbacterium deminutum TaxID=344164 RepID=A0ABN2QDH1_9MICO
MISLPKSIAAVAAATLGLGLAIAAPAQASDPKPPGDAPTKVVSAYFADWDVYGRGYFVKDIPVDKLNVIQYAFGVPSYDPASGAVGCQILDPWADFQQVYWGGENTVDGVADDPSNPDQHLFGNFNQLQKLKAANPHLKIEISLGGWTKSTWFATLASTQELREKFVASCIDTFIKGDLPGGGWPESAGGPGAAAGLFDGIDLDWEYPTQVADSNVNPTAADRHNATLLAAEFRKQLDAYGQTTGKHYLLTAALPAATSSTKYYELGAFVKSLDWANVMTYDFNVPSSPVSALNTLFAPDPRDPNGKNLTWNTGGTAAYYLLNGVPASKLVIGVPFYGNQYLRTGTKNYGLYTPFDNTGLDPNSLAADTAPQPTYHELVDQAGYVSADGKTGANGYTVRWNVLAGEPYLSSPAATHSFATGPETVPTVISFTSPASVAERVALIKSLKLRGAMVWEISQDSDSHSLMNAISPVLH